MNQSTDLNYSYVFEFERNFDYKLTTQWMSDNWKISFYWIFTYLMLIFSGQQWMRNREPFQLRSTLFLWNLFLALFSITGTLRVLPEMVYVVREHGFAQSVCDNGFITRVNVSSVWSWLFVMSKVPELGDTLFIVLRKQKLIFLHWYHHITVLLFTWYAYGDVASTGRWYLGVNYMIHAIMYSYYAMRAINIKIPKPIAMLITSSQLIQMVFGVFATLYALHKKSNRVDCLLSYTTIYSAIFMYFSYFVLFFNFFYHSYIKRSKNKQKSN